MRGLLAFLLLAMPLSGCLGADDAASSPEGESDAGAPPGPRDDLPVDRVLATTGRWLPPVDLGEAAIHATLLGDGRLLFWGGLHSHGPDGSPFIASPPNAESRVVDMAADPPVVLTPQPPDGAGVSDLFCVGQAVLPDGRVLAAGGTIWRPLPDPFFSASDEVRTYDPATNTWTLLAPMAFERWYPSVLGLPDGRALIASGIGNANDATGETLVRTLEVFDPATDTVTALPSSADRLLPMYPRLFVVPSGPLKGDVFFQPAGCLWCPQGAAPAESEWNLAASFDPASAAWTEHDRAVLGARNAPVTVLLALRPPEYDARILTATGTLARTAAATPTAEITDLSVEPPTHTLIEPMAQGRWFANHVLLPDGNVLVVGGAKQDGVLFPGSDANPVSAVMDAELFEPGVSVVDGAWRTVAPMTIPRVYHSTALLLPDGRVWVAGSVPAQTSLPGAERVPQTAAEVFEPPYLFRGPRPTITGAPASTTWGASFDVSAPDAADVTSVVLVRGGSVTHVYNAEQRLIELEIVGRTDGGLTVRAPPDGAIAPAGHYMLFIFAEGDGGAVPSVARMVAVGPAAV